MATNTGPDIITNGLVLCLDAADRNSYPGTGNTWYDLSGNGNNGTLVNGPTFSSSNRGSMVFDGVNDYVNINSIRNTIVGNINITVSFWVNFVSISNTFNFCLGVNPSDGTNRLLIGVGSAGDIVFHKNGTNDYTASGTITTSQWYNIVASNNTSGVSRLLINGVVQSGINNISTISFASNDTWTICAEYDSASLSDYVNGSISNFKIYNKILTDSQIIQNYNATKGRFGL